MSGVFRRVGGLVLLAFLAWPPDDQIMGGTRPGDVDFLDQRMRRKIGPRRTIATMDT